MIAPLTKLLHVSADELLGLTEAKPDLRRGELEEAYKKTWNTGDLDERMEIAKTAVNEYPGDMKYLEWFARCVNMRAHSYKDNSEYRAELEKSVKLYETVIDGTEDGEIKTSAISGIVMALSLLNRKDEALKYAEMYPDTPSLDKSDVMSWCLSGEEKLKHEQKKVESRLEDFLRQLILITNNIGYFNAAVEIIEIMIPDQNYLYFNDFLFICSIKQAQFHTQSGNYDDAISALRRALDYSIEYDRMKEEAPGIYRYTAPMLNLVEVDSRELVRAGGTKQDDFHWYLDSVWFDPLRDCADFKKLTEKKKI